jgi:hypothetical protein
MTAPRGSNGISGPVTAGVMANGDSVQPAPVRLRAWLQAAVFALLCVAAQGAGVPRWSRTMATACCWVSREPAANA